MWGHHLYIIEAGHVHQEDNIIVPENWKEQYNIRFLLGDRHKNDRNPGLRKKVYSLSLSSLVVFIETSFILLQWLS